MGVALRDIIAEYKTPVTWEALPGHRGHRCE